MASNSWPCTEYLELGVVLTAAGLQVIAGAWLSLTVTRNILEVLPQEFVAITITGVVPLKKVKVEGIGVENTGKVPIQYWRVADPVTVTLEPSVTNALQALAAVEVTILLAVRIGDWVTVIDFVALVIPQVAVTE